MNNYVSFRNKIKVSGIIDFKTAFHIGSGESGNLASKMPILRDYDNTPVLPGSTLKGNFRSTAEKLAEYFDMWACFFDLSLTNQNNKFCIGDEEYRNSNDTKNTLETLKKDKSSEKAIWDWINKNTCNVCKIFGSPMSASRVFFSDAQLEDWAGNVLIRDGVCIDRDSETAVDKAKYDYEVVPKDARYTFTLEMQNCEDNEIALIAAVISEWENDFRIGGFTSRGLGKGKLTLDKVETLDYSDPEQLKDYLINKNMKQNKTFFNDRLELALANGGADNA
ncbi:MAG: CRISPR-associated RAMP protein Csx7 [Candidatus Scalindua sp.]|nr:CRISPR-associated RAMP protein Csx7 [Candidatus Scalindua sp.]